MAGIDSELHTGSESDSDSDDEDYVPVAGEDSEASASEKDDQEEEENSESEATFCKKKKTKRAQSKQFSSDDTEKKVCKTEEEEKKHADSLWADFLKDVEPPKKPTKSCSVSASGAADLGQTANDCTAASTKVPTSNPTKVTITQVFDFAGESVTVTKEVDADSEEAKKYSPCSESSLEKNKEKTDKQSASTLASPHRSKRPAGIGNVLEKITSKKQKISTLNKSLLDWNQFKREEGIEEELQQFNKGKDGYLDRLAFLERADLRQFDLERNLRMTNRSKR